MGREMPKLLEVLSESFPSQIEDEGYSNQDVVEGRGTLDDTTYNLRDLSARTN